MSAQWIKPVLVILLFTLLGCGPLSLATPIAATPTQLAATPVSPVKLEPSATTVPAQPPAITQTRAPSPTQTPTQPLRVTAAPQPAAAVTLSAGNAARLKQVGQVHFNNPARLVWSTDGSRLVVFNNEGLLVLDGQTLETKKSLKMTQPDVLYDVAGDGQTMAVSGDHSQVELRSALTGQAGKSIAPPAPFNSLVFAPDGKSLALTSPDEIAASLWDVGSAKLIKTLSGFQTAAPVYDVSFTPDLKSLVWHARASVQLMDIASQKLGPAFGHEDFVLALAVSGDGKLLATSAGGTVNGDMVQLIYIWDTHSGKALGKIKLGDGCTALAFLPGTHLLAGGMGSQVSIWNADNGKPIVSLAGHSDRVAALAFSADGTTLASAGADNTVRLWQVNP